MEKDTENKSEKLKLANELNNQAKGLDDMANEWAAMMSGSISIACVRERAERLREKSRELVGFVPWSER